MGDEAPYSTLILCDKSMAIANPDQAAVVFLINPLLNLRHRLTRRVAAALKPTEFLFSSTCTIMQSADDYSRHHSSCLSYPNSVAQNADGNANDLAACCLMHRRGDGYT